MFAWEQPCAIIVDERAVTIEAGLRGRVHPSLMGYQLDGGTQMSRLNAHFWSGRQVPCVERLIYSFSSPAGPT